MGLPLDRRSALMAASGAAASLLLPAGRAAAAVSPERGLDAYARMLCGPQGEPVLWWYIGDLYLATPGRSVVPVARALTIGSDTAVGAGPRAFRYAFKEAGVIVDLATGDPLTRNPLTGAVVEVPLVDEPLTHIDWAMGDDGVITKTAHGRTSRLDLRWTETSDNLLLLETEPGPNAFGLAPADGGAGWKGIESTRTVYAKRASLERPGFVPALMIYQVSVKLTPPWLATPEGGDHWLVVRGIGQKSRAKDVVNRDALALVRRYFPGFLG